MAQSVEETPSGRVRPGVFEALVGVSPDAVFVVDDRGTIEFASPAVERLFAYRPDELVGQPIEMLVPDEVRGVHADHRADYAADPVARPMGTRLSLSARRRNGTTFPVDVSLAPVDVEGHLRVAAFVRDATERRRKEDLLRSVNEISQQLLAGRPTAETLPLAARQARTLVGAAACWVVTPARAGRLRVAAADGKNTEVLVGIELPPEASLSARAMAAAGPLVVEDLSADRAVLAEARALGLGPGLYLPMIAEDGPVGALIVGRAQGSDPFGEDDVAAVEVFAAAAGVVFALGEARDQLEHLQMVSEHERIARDLHDTVIQRLFALGMGLQGVQRLASGTVAERIDQAVDSLDEVIREIRETIFDLNRPGEDTDVRRKVREVAAEIAEQLGFSPRVAFRGPVEAAVSDQLATHVVAVVREALSNAARHAKASSVEVVVASSEGFVAVSVVDDGVGISEDPSAGSGLANMASRARQLGGAFELSRRHPSGTLLQWRVPTPAE